MGWRQEDTNDPQADQEVALMDSADEDDGVGKKLGITKSQTRRLKNPTLLTCLTVVLTIISLIGLLRDWSHYAFPEPIENEISQEDSGDYGRDNYVLNPEWDFDAIPQRRVYHWTISEKDHNPDGVFRRMIMVNGQFPGPLIEVNEGDTIVINVKNEASNATSIHWHGLYQNGTNHMDGTVGVTQCPIAPGISFTYEFRVIGQAGTYWWHSHMSAQASDGLYGPLIVHSKEEMALQKLNYSTDRVVMVSDHYYDPSSLLLMRYLASDRENIEPVPDSAVINGQSIRDCDQFLHRQCDNSTSNVGWPQIYLEPNQRHRLRIINAGAFAEIQVSLDEREFTITEVDGTDVLPENFHRLTILPAQRYSMVVDAGNASDLLWLRAKMIPTCFGEKNPDMQDETRAVVRIGKRYDNDETAQLPSSIDWSDATDLICKDMNTSSLVPARVVAAPKAVDASFYLRSNFEIGAYRLSRGFFNHSSFRPNLESPTLFRSIDGLSSGNSSFDIREPALINANAFEQSQEFVIQTTRIQVLDILVSNFDDGSHPLHLHGYKYFVLAQGHGYPPSDLTDTLDLSNPLRRDTATVEAFGWVLIRLVADNPGTWAFHCHVTWHSEAGLMMQLLTRTDDLANQKLPVANKALCHSPVSELKKGSTPEDDVFHAAHG